MQTLLVLPVTGQLGDTYCSAAGTVVRGAQPPQVLSSMLCVLLQILFNPNLWHGGFLVDSTMKHGVITEIRGLLARTGSLVINLAAPVLQRTMSRARSITLNSMDHTPNPGRLISKTLSRKRHSEPVPSIRRAPYTQ